MKVSQTSRLVVLRGFWQLIVLQAVTVPFFRDRGLSTSEIFLVQTVFTFVVTILDIPASVLSGRIGRRNSLVFAAIVKAVGGLLLVPNFHLAGILAAYVMIALGNSFYSGIEASLLYDGIKDSADAKQVLKDTLATSYTVTLSATIVANLLGGVIARYFGFQAVAYANAIFAFSSLLVTLTIKDVSPGRPNVSGGKISATPLRDAASILTSRQRLPMLALMIVIGVAGPVFNTLMQLHLDERHVDLLWFGLLVAAQNGLGALLGLLLRGPISVKLGRWRPDMLVLLPAIAAFGLLNTASLLTIPMVLAGIEAAKGIAFVIVSGELSSSYESDARATVLSMQSVLIRIASIGVNSALAASSQSRASGQLCFTLAVALGGIAVIYKLFVSKYDGQSFSTNVAKCVNPEG